jgi:hypothetical protein
MKTLSKLCINHEKVLKVDELKSLKGGLWQGQCWVYDGQACVDYYITQGGFGWDEEDVEADCESKYSSWFWCDCLEWT